MTARGVYELGMERLTTFNLMPLLPALRACNPGALEDVKNINGSAYYQWICGVVDELKPKQVVELGGAMGVWSLCVLHTLPSDSMLYSISLPENGLEFSYVVDNYPNFKAIVGSDLDVDNFKGVDLSATDIWFFDALHTEEHLRKELELYSPYFKKGCLIIFDDVRSFGLYPVWEDIIANKYGNVNYYEATDPLHFTGYGLCVKE